MRKLLLLGALAFFAFTASAQSDEPSANEKVKTEKVCAKTGKTCSETCSNKKTETCCNGKTDSEKKACCSKDGNMKSCAKQGEKSSCSKSCSKTSEKTKDSKTKSTKRSGTKSVVMSK